MTASTGKAPARIFMSYRRDDTAYPAGWLYDRLVSHFGRNQIFKDIDSIELGDDFVQVITAAVGSCDVLLAVIGDQWLTITDQDGRRRLDNPGDFVRVEIEAALARNVRVIPILVDGARMPHADELPASLSNLTRRQALYLSPHRFNADTGLLLNVLDRTVAHGRRVEQLQGQIRERAAAQDWDAVVAASDELAALHPAAADPDGLASVAREQVAWRQQAEQAAALHRRWVEQLQGQIRERAAAQDWDAVVAASDELAALDPAAADPDGLASVAREQVAWRQQAEQAAALHRRRVERTAPLDTAARTVSAKPPQATTTSAKPPQATRPAVSRSARRLPPTPTQPTTRAPQPLSFFALLIPLAFTLASFSVGAAIAQRSAIPHIGPGNWIAGVISVVIIVFLYGAWVGITSEGATSERQEIIIGLTFFGCIIVFLAGWFLSSRIGLQNFGETARNVITWRF